MRAFSLGADCRAQSFNQLDRKAKVRLGASSHSRPAHPYTSRILHDATLPSRQPFAPAPSP